MTGARGRLGPRLLPRLEARGHTVLAAGRAGPVRLDLATGEGLSDAVEGVDAVFHLASSAFGDPRAVDVEGTRRLLAAFRGGHFVYPSIVGVDRMPIPYYRAKLDAERVVADSGVPHTILRITQFHVFLRETAESLLRWPIVVAPRGVRFQPIDEDEAAEALAACLETGPRGRAPDLGGPEVVELADVVHRLKGDRWRCVITRGIPSVGPLAALRAGALCLDDGGVRGRRSFEDWLSGPRPAAPAP